jgi:hypothetical protein
MLKHALGMNMRDHHEGGTEQPHATETCAWWNASGHARDKIRVATPSLCLLALDSTPERDHVVSARAGESKALQHEQNTRGPIALDVPPPGFSLSPTTHSSSFNLSFTFTFAMSITFNPPLDTATVLAVPPSYLDGAELDLCFSAKFDSAEALAAVQRDNVRVELWSNIPVVGRSAGKRPPASPATLGTFRRPMFRSTRPSAFAS